MSVSVSVSVCVCVHGGGEKRHTPQVTLTHMIYISRTRIDENLTWNFDIVSGRRAPLIFVEST